MLLVELHHEHKLQVMLHVIDDDDDECHIIPQVTDNENLDITK